MKNYNQAFRDKFSEFEAFMKNEFHNEKFDTKFICNNTLLMDNQEFWKQCVALRNIYSHSNGANFADITKESYNLFCSEVERIMKPKCALDIAIKDVYKVQKDVSVCDVITTMLAHNYTCTPIVDASNVVIGVFSSHSLMNYLSKECSILSKDFVIGNLIEFCPIEGDLDIEYAFVDETIPEYDVREMFKNSYDKHKRLEAVFVTQSGKSDAKLLGIITHWDLQ